MNASPYAPLQLVAGSLGALDVGGSITIHAFGAVYGLAASFWLSPKGAGAHPKNKASYTSDMTAIFGTLFLFIYWWVLPAVKKRGGLVRPRGLACLALASRVHEKNACASRPARCRVWHGSYPA